MLVELEPTYQAAAADAYLTLFADPRARSCKRGREDFMFPRSALRARCIASVGPRCPRPYRPFQGISETLARWFTTLAITKRRSLSRLR